MRLAETWQVGQASDCRPDPSVCIVLGGGGRGHGQALGVARLSHLKKEEGFARRQEKRECVRERQKRSRHNR
jgi:hypothetical protein